MNRLIHYLCLLLSVVWINNCYEIFALASIESGVTMSTKALVTGANRGLGLEICKQLCSDDKVSTVYAACRTPSDELNALAEQEKDKITILDGIDVTDEKSASLLKEKLGDDTVLHLLIHNAGAYGPSEPDLSTAEFFKTQTLENVTRERILYSFELNAVAPLLLTQSLLPNLKKTDGSNTDTIRKIIIIGSAMGSISDNGSGGHYGYRAAKSAVNMIGKSLSIDLKKDNIAVGIVHPGYVYTGFEGINQPKHKGQRDVDESVKGVLQAIEQVNMDNTGCYLHGNYGEGVKTIGW